MEIKQYYIQTRTVHGWHRIAPLPNYDSIKDAQLGLKKHLDSLFFEYGEMDIPTNIFRIVRYKQKGLTHDVA